MRFNKIAKPFNESISKDILQDISDICLELSDQSIHSYISGEYYKNISISKPLDENFMDGHPVYGITKLTEFYWKNIEDTILRILDYLESNMIKIYKVIGNQITTKWGSEALNTHYGKNDLVINRLKRGSYNSFLELKIFFEQ